jgi:hypothetical protein
MADVEELYRAPFGEFIARRDALAKALRKDGRREKADEVKRLKKPALSAWALNQLPREAVEGLLAAGAALRQARGGDTLRDATREEREAVEDLASQATALLRQAGHPVTDKTAAEIRETLHAAALDEDAREQLASGRLVAPKQAIGLGGFAGAPAPAPTPKKKTQTQKQKQKDEAEAKRRREDEARRREEEKARRAAIRDAARAVKERERELVAAQKALDQARAELERLQS